jgi:NADH-quinone oxidoreductase subunit G
LRRVHNRYHSRVNGYFLCDRGRFGYEFVHGEGGLEAPRVSNEGSPPVILGLENALGRVEALVKGRNGCIGVGSPRASLEANFALRRLVGESHFYGGVSAGERERVDLMLEILRTGPARTPSLSDIETAGAVLVLGEDLTQVAPRMALAARQSVRHAARREAADRGVPSWHDAAVRDAVVSNPGKIFLLHPHATHLDDAAIQAYHGAPVDLARIGFAVAHALDEKAPVVGDLEEDEKALVTSIVEALKAAERPVVISGPSCGEDSLIRAAAHVVWSLCALEKDAALSFTTPECNTLGMALLGGRSLEDAFRAAESGKVSTVIVLENDLYRRAAPSTVQKFLQDVEQVVAVDHIETETTRSADVVLSCGSFAESDGTWVSSEGRAQRFYKVLPVKESSTRKESWRLLSELLTRSSSGEAVTGWGHLDDLRSEMARSLPGLDALDGVAPSASFRMLGQKIPRQTWRSSGRTALHAQLDIHETKPPEDQDSPLCFSMEGYAGQPPSSLITQFHAPSWNSVQSVNKFQKEVGGTLRGGDPGVRLIEASAGRPPSYGSEVPARFRAREGSWYVLPLYHIFGSEELSARAPGVRERAPAPYVALHPEDAEIIGVGENGTVEVVLDGEPRPLPARLWSSLPRGVIGLPIQLLQRGGFQIPTWTSISKVKTG